MMTDQDVLQKVAFVGGGNMASAIIGGLHQHGSQTNQLMVIEPSAEKRAQLNHDFGVIVNDQVQAALQQSIIVLAVKPQQLQSVCAALRPEIKDQLIISIAAGIRSESIVEWLGGHQKVIRVMPNTPAQVQAGISALYALNAVTEDEKQAADQLMRAVGTTTWLEDESQMDAITAISGSGPAYVFYCIEALQEAAMKLGLPEQQSQQLALQTFLGASQLASTSEDSVETLRKKVTSKGGTTEKGLAVLAENEIKSIFYQTAKAAAKQSVILGDQLSKS